MSRTYTEVMDGTTSFTEPSSWSDWTPNDAKPGCFFRCRTRLGTHTWHSRTVTVTPYLCCPTGWKLSGDTCSLGSPRYVEKKDSSGWGTGEYYWDYSGVKRSRLFVQAGRQWGSTLIRTDLSTTPIPASTGTREAEEDPSLASRGARVLTGADSSSLTLV